MKPVKPSGPDKWRKLDKVDKYHKSRDLLEGIEGEDVEEFIAAREKHLEKMKQKEADMRKKQGGSIGSLEL